MRATKDSGISWLGEYPSDWELKKIKYCLQERVEKNNPVRTTEILSLTAKQGVIPYDQKEGGGNKPKEDVSAYRLAYPGDIVMNSMNILSGSVGLSQYFGCVSPVYYMLRPWKVTEDVRYYNYTLGQFTRNYTQTTKRGLLTTKQAEHQAQESARCSACFVVRGFQRGLPLGTRLCLQSVVCYTLCRRCRENAVAAGEGKGV